MSILNIIRSLIKKNIDRYNISYNAFGVQFKSDHHEQCLNGECSPLIQNQYVFLQMLLEKSSEDDVVSLKDGFFLSSEVVCSLDQSERELLGLLPLWNGKFELITNGHTLDQNFNVKLRLINNGVALDKYNFTGCRLIINDEEYIPTFPQFMALSAVKQFQDIDSEKRTEVNNLAVIYALQKAGREGAKIALRHFGKIDICEAEHLKISIKERSDGGLHLIPEFGLGLKPEEIETRLHQLNATDSFCMRVNNKFVILDEKKLRGIQEIIANRDIPSKERENFFKSPASFLDAFLIDLDNGFSLRVFGSEKFKPAYFGIVDKIRNDWFGENYDGQIFTLSSIAPILKDESEDNTEFDLQSFIDKAKNCFLNKNPSFEFGNNTILIPLNKDEFDSSIEIIKDYFQKIKPSDKQQPIDHTEESNNDKRITVGIELNDEVAFNEMQNSYSIDSYYYSEKIDFNFLKFKPFPHQVEGIRWLVGHFFHANNVGKNNYEGVLLADDMGLGKTFVTLASIYIIHNILKNKNIIIKPILIVAPVGLLNNWKEEIDKFFKDNLFFDDIIILHSQGSLNKFRSDTKKDSFEEFALKIGSKYGFSRLDLPNRLILISYEMLRTYTFSLCSIDWEMVIFDEAQKIKNPNALSSRSAKGLNADFRLAVTGTPVENQLTDFWNIFDTVYPGLLGKYKEFQKLYIHPIVVANGDSCTRIDIGKKLRNKVSHFMIRRIKEDNLKDLPKKYVYIGKSAHGISLEPLMNDVQLITYDSVLHYVKINKNKENKKELFFSSLHRLKNISLHHLLDQGGTIPIPSDKNEALTILKQSAKLAVLIDILNLIRKRDEKVIIFLINKKLQYFLSISLRLIYNINNVSIINGDTKSIVSKSSKDESRYSIIDKFQKTNGFNIIIMSPLAAGFGLTITAANNVVHLERHWNPAKESQSTDRVYRIGQSRDVNIYIPIVKHPNQMSFEENLNELLSRKIDLKDSIVTPQEIHPNDFNLDGIFSF